MSRFSQLDALVVRRIVESDAVTFAWGGVDYQAAVGPRNTERSLMEGGFISDSNLVLLVDVLQYGSATRPYEGQKIDVCVDADGIPCHTDDATTRVAHRINKIGRSGAALRYELVSDKR